MVHEKHKNMKKQRGVTPQHLCQHVCVVRTCSRVISLSARLIGLDLRLVSRSKRYGVCSYGQYVVVVYHSVVRQPCWENECWEKSEKESTDGRTAF